jgi:hypothetical protein
MRTLVAVVASNPLNVTYLLMTVTVRVYDYQSTYYRRTTARLLLCHGKCKNISQFNPHVNLSVRAWAAIFMSHTEAHEF